LILQTNKKLRPEIQKEGCYLMCLICEGIGATDQEGPLPEKINFLYETFLKSGWINARCLCLEPAKILNFFGVSATQMRTGQGKIQIPATYKPFLNEIEILEYKMPTYSHFVLGDGAGGIAYDPYGISPAVSNGKLASKRIFIRKVEPTQKRDNKIE